MKNKVFRNLDEQIEILRAKGLMINDIEKTKMILLKENYFFVSGYRHLFMKDGKDKYFMDGTTFEELYSTFVFDRNIRNIFFKNILIIENNVKSLISYQMSKKYGFKDFYLIKKPLIIPEIEGLSVINSIGCTRDYDAKKTLQIKNN